ncbi:unnamed protein product [Effrenium voratum]|uniref:Uncharacterized protein n=1 Tax=Effrenium voratum TaxID=2562239 RepID=A0AA36MVC5_9DINO|nr:unnamed protein product [Effrenium voratum]
MKSSPTSKTHYQSQRVWEAFHTCRSVQLCARPPCERCWFPFFGGGPRRGSPVVSSHRMFYFPYHSGFAVVQEGAPGLYTQLTRSEKIAEKFGSRMAMLNILEYQAGRDRQGEKMVEGFFCDLLVVSVESWRHLPQGIHTLTPLVRAGMTGFQGERGRGFGFSTMKDVFFVLLHEPCERKVGGQLDKDDEDGQALIHACRFMEDLQEWTPTGSLTSGIL